MATKLARISELSAKNPEMCFTSVGHLINKDTALARLINFVFPPEAAVPVTLQYKIRLHEQLAELVADRYGYMATEDLGVCVTAFFKMASGLDLEKSNVEQFRNGIMIDDRLIPSIPFACKRSISLPQ